MENGGKLEGWKRMDTKDGYTRRTFLKTLGLGAAALAAPRYLDAADTRLNIVFILSDDHAMEAIGCYDSWLKDYVHTPFIDSIAAEGMRLTNVCCNMSLCSPSRASIITGQYAHKNGVKVLKGSLSPHAPSYVIELHNTGYQTAIYGKWHMSQMPRGCDDYAITTGQGNYFNPSLQTPDGTKNYTGYYADVYADLALDFLSSAIPQNHSALISTSKAHIILTIILPVSRVFWKEWTFPFRQISSKTTRKPARTSECRSGSGCTNRTAPRLLTITGMWANRRCRLTTARTQGERSLRSSI